MTDRADMAVEMGKIGWAWLPNDILHSIADLMETTGGVIRFGAVCREWQSVAARNFESNTSRRRHQVPLLMMRDEGRLGELRSVTQNWKKYEFRVPFPDNTWYCVPALVGTCWFFLIMDVPGDFVLFNPLSGDTINFPRLRDPDFPNAVIGFRGNLRKAVLSADPSLQPHDYILMVLYLSLGYLAFIKPGGENWTFIDYDKRINSVQFRDIIYWRSQFYAVDVTWNHLVSIEIDDTGYSFKNIEVPSAAAAAVVSSSSSTSTSTVSSDHSTYLRCVLGRHAREGSGGILYYLAESLEGELLCVVQSRKKAGSEFWVYQIVADENDEVAGWVKKEDLGDSAIFIGGGSSCVSVSASRFRGCRPNSIYWLENEDQASFPRLLWRRGGPPVDVGVFDVKDRSISRFEPTTANPNPIWISLPESSESSSLSPSQTAAPELPTHKRDQY